MNSQDIEGSDTKKSNNDQSRPTSPAPEETKVVTSIHVAPSATTEYNDRRAVRCRIRRERPRKIRLESEEGHGESDTQRNLASINNLFEPDVESFVSNCVPGVSFVSGLESKQRHTEENSSTVLAQRRANLIRKRSLPLLSFLSSTSLAAAEKKRKKEEKERLQALAEEEAKRIAAIDYTDTFGDTNANTEGDITPPNKLEGGTSESEQNQTNNLPLTSASSTKIRGDSTQATASHEKPAMLSEGKRETKQTNTTTVTIEKTSNILMPPLLEKFLDSLKKIPR